MDCSIMGPVCSTGSTCFVVKCCLKDKTSTCVIGMPGGVSVQDLKFVKMIGKGSFSRVILAMLGETCHPVAVKVMSKVHIVQNKQCSQVFSEKAILQRMSSPFVVDFLCTLQDAQSLYCVMEYLPGGELFRLIYRKVRLTPEEARFYVSEVVAGLAHLHSQSCLYRDLKPENILIRSSGHIKLTDFGWGKILAVGERTFTLSGTPEYLAPEIIEKSGHGFASDWWQVGILIYEMLAGSSPFMHPSPYKLYENILVMAPDYPEELFAPTTVRLLQGLLCKDPQLRFTEKEVRAHAYFGELKWEEVETLRLKPPFKPQLSDQFDTSYFEEFEEETVTLPARTHISTSAQDLFADY